MGRCLSMFNSASSVFQKKQLKIDKEVALEQVYDFRILRSLMSEMKK